MHITEMSQNPEPANSLTLGEATGRHRIQSADYRILKNLLSGIRALI